MPDLTVKIPEPPGRCAQQGKPLERPGDAFHSRLGAPAALGKSTDLMPETVGSGAPEQGCQGPFVDVPQGSGDHRAGKDVAVVPDEKGVETG